MEYRKLRQRYRQFGGLRLVREYSKLGLIPKITLSFFRCLYKRQSFKQIYPTILKTVDPVLKSKYYPLIKERKQYYAQSSLVHNHTNIVWFCWLQGISDAPEIVRVCYRSLQCHLHDREIRIVDEKNWAEYVDMPNYILDRWGKGQIPPAMFSDLLRLQLLISYGGSWIDATVFCSGVDNTKEYLDADLFMFQYTKPGSSVFRGISNWFISSCTNNEVLMVLRDVLFEYWKDYDCVINYYIFHFFFLLLAREYPEIVSKMPYGYSINSLLLMDHWNDPFEQGKWKSIVSLTPFHKLSYRVSKETQGNPGNIYNYILNSSLSCS